MCSTYSDFPIDVFLDVITVSIFTSLFFFFFHSSHFKRVPLKYFAHKNTCCDHKCSVVGKFRIRMCSCPVHYWVGSCARRPERDAEGQKIFAFDLITRVAPPGPFLSQLFYTCADSGRMWVRVGERRNRRTAASTHVVCVESAEAGLDSPWASSSSGAGVKEIDGYIAACVLKKKQRSIWIK